MTTRLTLSILIPVFMLSSLVSCWDNSDYTSLCREIAETTGNPPERHLAIYLDVRSCLSCCEDMSAWQKLERELPELGVGFSLWAPREDSLDVAIAMELEGMKTPVRVLSGKTVKALKWDYYTPPIKVLFDAECKPVKTLGPAGGATDSRRVVDELLAELSPGGSVDSTKAPTR